MRAMVKIGCKYGKALLIEANITHIKKSNYFDLGRVNINGYSIGASKDIGSDHWELIAGDEETAEKKRRRVRMKDDSMGIDKLPTDGVRREVRSFIKRHAKNGEMNGYSMDYNGPVVWFGWDDATTWKWGEGRERGLLFEQDVKNYLRNQGRAVGVSVVFD